MDKKIFVIINSYYLGDILLVNPLVQNIKRIYKDAYVVMLSNKTYYEAAKNQKGVDEVIIWDRKNKHKSIFGTLKFILTFPYKNIYAVFPIYGMDRPTILGRLLNPKYNVALNKGDFAGKFLKYEYENFYKMSQIQEQHLSLLKGITKEDTINCKMEYNPIPFDFKYKDYICLCPVSSRKEKDMPYDTVVEIIKNAKNKVILLGTGSVSKELSEKLKAENLDNLIDFSNKTSINEAGWILKNSIGTISVDTGLLHLSLAVGAKTVGLFYTDDTKFFIPDKKIYDNSETVEDKAPLNILSSLYKLINGD